MTASFPIAYVLVKDQLGRKRKALEDFLSASCSSDGFIQDLDGQVRDKLSILRQMRIHFHCQPLVLEQLGFVGGSVNR